MHLYAYSLYIYSILSHGNGGRDEGSTGRMLRILMAWEKKLLLMWFLPQEVEALLGFVTASSVAHIYILVEVHGGGIDVSDVLHDQPLKALHNGGCQYYGTIVISA